MLSKLLKNDLKRNMRWLWILFVGTIIVAGISRGCKELGDNILFFKILGIIFDSIFYTLLVNGLLHPFLRNFLNFTKSFYSDEAYLTHTLPVTKSQLVNSKFITAIIEIFLGFVSAVLSLIIMFASPTMLDTLKLLLSMIITGEFSVILVLILFVLLVMVEFLMFISIIYFSIVIAYREKEKRVLKTFLYTVAFSLMASMVLSVVMVIVLLINKINLTSTTLILPISSVVAIILSGIIVYSIVSTIFYFLTKKAFNKGVNVD